MDGHNKCVVVIRNYTHCGLKYFMCANCMLHFHLMLLLLILFLLIFGQKIDVLGLLCGFKFFEGIVIATISFF
jgi:hypothetical protein